MEKMGNLFFTLHVYCKDNYEVKGKEKTTNQILFDGKVEGGFFNGIVLPGGVDTQVYNSDGSGTLSARYTLEGVDDCGQKCRIFVQNEAPVGAQRTAPKLITDSKSLSWIEQKECYGTLECLRDEVLIKVFYI